MAIVSPGVEVHAPLITTLNTVLTTPTGLTGELYIDGTSIAAVSFNEIETGFYDCAVTIPSSPVYQGKSAYIIVKGSLGGTPFIQRLGVGDFIAVVTDGVNVESFDQTALAQMATDDTGQAQAAANSVAKLAQADSNNYQAY